MPGIPNNPPIGGGVPLTTFSNFGFIGSPDFLPKRQIPQHYQYTDTISRTHGTHSFKVGVTLWLRCAIFSRTKAGRAATSDSPASSADFPYADGLLGYTQSTQLTNVLLVDQRLWMPRGFFEDDWKVTRKLTLNLGLRYDFATPALAGNNQMANFDPAGSGSLVFAKGGSLEDRSLVQVNTKNFGPRFGVSVLAR